MYHISAFDDGVKDCDFQHLTWTQIERLPVSVPIISSSLTTAPHHAVSRFVLKSESSEKDMYARIILGFLSFGSRLSTLMYYSWPLKDLLPFVQRPCTS